MLNGQLKPGYNVQISTENQFITTFSIYRRPTDTLIMINYLESFRLRYGVHSLEIEADSGYGSEKNYEYVCSNEVQFILMVRQLPSTNCFRMLWSHLGLKQGLAANISHGESGALIRIKKQLRFES